MCDLCMCCVELLIFFCLCWILLLIWWVWWRCINADRINLLVGPGTFMHFSSFSCLSLTFLIFFLSAETKVAPRGEGLWTAAAAQSLVNCSGCTKSCAATTVRPLLQQASLRISPVRHLESRSISETLDCSSLSVTEPGRRLRGGWLCNLASEHDSAKCGRRCLLLLFIYFFNFKF